MSVQLIVYPQTSQGATSTSTTTSTTVDTSTNYIVDGENFSSINLSSTTQVNWPPFYSSYSNSVLGSGSVAINAVAPNTWYRWRYPDTGTQPDYPVQIGWQLLLNNITQLSNTSNGFFQRVSLPSAIVTGNHWFRLYVRAKTAGGLATLRLRQYNTAATNFLLQGNKTFKFTSTNFVTQTFDFWLPSFGDQTLFFYYEDGPELEIEYIRVYGLVTSSITSSFFDLKDQVILDLYEDESIPLTLSCY